MNFEKLPTRPNRYKIISFGDSKTGKTCLIKRYYERRFVPKYLPTIGVDYGHTTVTIDEKEYLINIFDFSGDSMFYEVRNEFYAGTQGALLVFDVTNRKSFENLDWWLAEMCQEMEVSEYYRASIIVCANKIDSGNRLVSTLEGRTWAENLGLPYLETSACTNEGVDNLFEYCFKSNVSCPMAKCQLIVTGKECSDLPSCLPECWACLYLCKQSTFMKKLFRNIMKADETWKEDKTPGNTNLHQSRANNNRQSLNTDATRRDMIDRLNNGRDDLEKLGLRKGATAEEVNRAFRRLAVVLHPDKNSEPGAEEVFKKLTSIRYAVLGRLAPSNRS